MAALYEHTQPIRVKTAEQEIFELLGSRGNAVRNMGGSDITLHFTASDGSARAVVIMPVVPEPIMPEPAS